MRIRQNPFYLLDVKPEYRIEEINEAAVSIEDEDTAKGLLEEAPVQEENMSFWWLLLIALLGEAGREMYVKHKKKQEEKAKIDE